MKIEEVLLEVNQAPTMMPLADELRVIDHLMQVPLDTVRAHRAELRAIVKRLSQSHTQAFFEIDDQSMPLLLAFSRWLDALAQSSETERVWLHSLAEDFRSDPRVDL